ncbi:SDR family NAD(P)-dependent oxidoreductase [Sphingobium estronivorans]|uniref:SDR family NAD(P)-dependent oxidoreductase n=1 Tax=Sphingobium estronivorans TaxID=1577690 RepID=UPI00123A009C|nr:SDR family NAD(P)-dependent oxidoreductase [Sphingobium estronivorans]
MSGPLDFTGKIALVTGASSGIGQATAEYLAERGASVAVVARNVDRGRETTDRILSAGRIAIFIHADVEKPEAIAAMVKKTVDHFGRLDIAFNNAGMTGTVAPFHEQELADWEQVIRTNLSSIFLSMKHQITAMLKCGGGTIVNNCSGAGVMAAPGLPHYTAAKHGVLGLTKAAAKEYAPHGIRVNAICPGFIETPQLGQYIDGADTRAAVEASIPIGYMGQPIDIAHAVAFLASAEGAYISGDTMFVDGAIMCR